MRGGWLAGALSLVVALTPVAAVLRAPVLGTAVVLATAGDAAARAGGSSGGYSRPSVRTPSFSAPSRSPSYSAPLYSAPRTPSTSGSYGRPSSQSGGFGAVPFFGGSQGDRAFSRERSSQALDARRAQEDAARRAQVQQQQQRQAPQGGGGFFGGGGGGFFGGGQRYGGYAQTSYSQRPSWFGQQGWQAPSYATGGQRSFGVWNGLFLWFMLDNLTRPGYGDFFRGHQSDPGYQQWRSQANALAAENTDLKRKLDALDQTVAIPSSTPVPAALPPGIPADVAAADVTKVRTPGVAANDNNIGRGGVEFSTVVLVVLVGAAGLAYLAWRRRAARTSSQGGGPMTPLGTAANLVRNAVSGQPYKPELFHVGMTITADPTPFILAAGATKVPAPTEAGGNMLLSVDAVGRVAEGAASLVRLYLPDGSGANRRAMFQLHLDEGGSPDECRYFGIIDEVSPADPNEWGVWLDPAEGLIGWPEFQTKDGRIYARVWAPGPQRVAPRVFDEAIAGAAGTETVRNQTMLYAAPTGVAEPAPQTEYILVSALQRQGQAWVEIRAGIDVNPAALSLA